MLGSSPRVRGTQTTRATRQEPIRFIPARAGNSTIPSYPSARTTVHPRACGELKSERYFYDAEAGSSPRVRGTPSWGRTRKAGQRFIPARAGNSPCVTINAQGINAQGTPVHPRACGELCSRDETTRSPGGSSPRVRGTHWRAVPRTARPRFIPARAGNSPFPHTSLLQRPVHPRACGELI